MTRPNGGARFFATSGAARYDLAGPGTPADSDEGGSEVPGWPGGDRGSGTGASSAGGAVRRLRPEGPHRHGAQAGGAAPAEEGGAAGTLGNARPGDGVVVVAETIDGGLVQEVLTGRDPTADGPAADGGRAPDPYELLLLSLGACTAVALRRYASGEGWPLGRVTVRLRHARGHAEDCEGNERDSAALDRIERTVDLPGPLDAAQRTRLMRVADACPVRRALAAGVEVRTLPARNGPD